MKPILPGALCVLAGIVTLSASRAGAAGGGSDLSAVDCNDPKQTMNIERSQVIAWSCFEGAAYDGNAAHSYGKASLGAAEAILADLIKLQPEEHIKFKYDHRASTSTTTTSRCS